MKTNCLLYPSIKDNALCIQQNTRNKFPLSFWAIFYFLLFFELRSRRKDYLSTFILSLVLYSME